MLGEYPLSLSQHKTPVNFRSRLEFRLCEYITTSFLVTGMCDEFDTIFPLLE